MTSVDKNTRVIYPAPNPELYNLILKSAETLCNAAKRFPDSDIINGVWDFGKGKFKSPKFIKKEFRAAWFLWRAILPISIISNVDGITIFQGRPFFVERSLAIWVAIKDNDISTPSIGRVLDRDHTSILNSFNSADNGMKDYRSPFFMLMNDVIEVEKAWLSKR